MVKSRQDLPVKYSHDAESADQRQLVQSVLKTISLVEAFLDGPESLSLKELVRRTGYPAPTTHRLLATLEYAGWAVRTPNGNYRLSLHMAEIGRHVLAGINLREQALVPMQELSQKTGETAYLMVREGEHAVCVERVESQNMVRVMSSDVGSVLRMYAGAAPLALLAFSTADERHQLLHAGPLETPNKGPLNPKSVEKRLKEFRAAGFTVSSDELVPGISSVGAPIFGRDGTVVAAVSVGGLTSSIMGDRLDSLATAVCEAGRVISMALGFGGKYPPNIETL